MLDVKSSTGFRNPQALPTAERSEKPSDKDTYTGLFSCHKLTVSATLTTTTHRPNLAALAYSQLLESQVRKLSMKTEEC